VSKIRAVAIELDALSPNQLAKRQQIVASAQIVLLRVGLSGCTTREVARESGLNKGLIYYYFESIDEIVDAAMMAFAEDAAERLPPPGDERRTDIEALLGSYLSLFSARQGLPLLWLEYWTTMIRAGRSEQLVRLANDAVDLLAEAFDHTDVDGARVRARIVFSYIVGVVTRGLAQPEVFEELGSEIERVAHAMQPGSTSVVAEQD
jgi:AcrR family transcriptional regulator